MPKAKKSVKKQAPRKPKAAARKAPPIRVAKPTPKLPTFNATQFAKIIGVSVETVSNLVDAGMPCERGTRQGSPMAITLEAALPFVFDRRGERQGSQRDRLATAQAEKFELENARRRGELLLASDVAAQDMALAADFAGRLDGIPGRLANELAGISDPIEVRRRLLEELRAVRAGFAEAIRKQADAPAPSDDSGDDLGAAAEPDSGRVGGPDQNSPAGDSGAGSLAQ